MASIPDSPEHRCYSSLRVPSLASCEYRSLVFGRLFVGLPCLTGSLLPTDFRYRDVPPSAHSGHPFLWIHRNYNNCDAISASRIVQRLLKLVSSTGDYRVGAHRFGVLLKIDRNVFTGQLLRPAITISQLVAKIRYADRTLQPEDALVAMIIDQDDRQTQPLAHGCHNFEIHHQVGAVSHHHDHFAIRVRQLDPDTSRNFVAHTRKTVFHVISFRIFWTPKAQ